MSEIFDLHCTDCSRLRDFLLSVKAEHPAYHCLPVAPFGAADPALLIVGLAPGKHGANATGRPFTGDHAGILLYETLFETGFGSKPESISADDDLKLINCRITNAVKCLPPDNKPVGAEITLCNRFLREEISRLKKGAVVMALGSIAHTAVLKALSLKLSQYKFGHASVHALDEITLIDSYHCSRYNTQTKRLTPDMFKSVFKQARELINVA